MNRWWYALGLVATFALGVVAGSLWKSEPARPADRSPVVARYRHGVITAADLAAELESLGTGASERVRTSEGQRDVVRELVRRRDLARLATSEGLDRAPAFRIDTERRLADAYLKKVVDEKAKAPPTEADLRAYFDAHRSAYVQPERFLIASILLETPASGDARAHREKEAAALLAKLRASKDFYAFDTAARAHSDDTATRALGGELPLMEAAEFLQRFGAGVDEVFGPNAQSGALATRPLPTAEGFVILQLLRRDAAVKPSLTEVTPTLRRRWASERREQLLRDLQTRLDAEAQLEFSTEALAAASRPASAD